MKFRLVCLIGAALFIPAAQANVVLNLSAEDLRDESNNLMPTTGLVLLAASTTDNVFDAPTADDFLPGSDDVVLAKWALESSRGPGKFAKSFQAELTDHPNWTPGDHLRLYWYPDLTESSATPGAGTPYGTYRSDSPEIPDLTEPWVTPSDGSNVSIAFLSEDRGGPVGNSGQANELTPVPEPSFYAGVFAAGCLAWAVLSRKRREAKLA